MKPIAVIGAGITGLVAAFALKRKGISVEIHEKSERSGGVIRSVRKDGFLAEGGPNTLLETSPRISGLIGDLGLKDRMQYTSQNAQARYIVRKGKPVAVPSTPMGFLTSGLFSSRAKWNLLREPFVPVRSDHEEESVADFVRRRLGQEFLERAVDPMVAGIYAGDPEKLSVAHAFPRLVAVEQKYGSLIKGQILGARERKKSAEVSKDRAPKFSFPNGLQEVVEALDAALKGSIRHGSIAQKISRGESSLFLASSVEKNDTRSEYSAVLYAGTAFGLSELQMDSAPGVNLHDFAEIIYPPVASVVLGFRREDVDHPCEGFGMLVPSVEGRNILGAIFSSSLFPDRAPEGCLTLTSYVGGERNPQLAHLPAKELVSTVLSDLRGLLGIRGNPTFEHTCFYPRAIPQYNVGYGKFLDLMNVIEAKVPGFFLAGHFRNGVSLSDSILAGLAVAERIEIYLSQSQKPGRPESS